MSDRPVPPLVAPRDHKGKADENLALKKLEKQGYVPRICKEKNG